jgi:hypothetical protein
MAGPEGEHFGYCFAHDEIIGISCHGGELTVKKVKLNINLADAVHASQHSPFPLTHHCDSHEVFCATHKHWLYLRKVKEGWQLREFRNMEECDTCKSSNNESR